MFAVADAIPPGLRKQVICKSARWRQDPAEIHGVDDNLVRLDESVRSTRVLEPTAEVVDELMAALQRYVPELEDHFNTEVERLERCQVLRYTTGDRFRKHTDGRAEQDGSGPSLRKVSLVAMLSESDTYEGGAFVIFPDSLELHGRGFGLSLPAGSLIAFRSDLPHEVTPVTAGERHSVVSWAR